jgi:uncharacterized protein
VNNSDNPLRLNVGYLFNKPIGTSRDIPVEFDALEIDDLNVRNLESVVRVSRTREGLLLQVTAEAEIEAECVRCLEQFYQPVEVAFEELYQFPSRHREETDLVLPPDGYIDLAPLYREYLLLAVPIKSICRQDCQGLCVVCGANLNETTCEHQNVQDDSSVIMEDEEPD